MPRKPILIGHSFGGMIVEKLLGDDFGIAGIAIDAAQIKGVLPLPLSALRATLPVFKNPANRHRAVSLTAEQFRYSFGNAVSEAESDELHQRWTAARALAGQAARPDAQPGDVPPGAIFISYSRAGDGAAAERLSQGLLERKLPAWLMR